MIIKGISAGRLSVASLIIALLYIVLTGLAGPIFGKISTVTTTDPAAFLPASAESTRANELQEDFTGSDEIPALIVAELDVDPQALAELAELKDAIAQNPGVAQVLDPQPAEDGRAVQMIALLDTNQAQQAVKELREYLAEQNVVAQGEARFSVGGPAGLSTDLAGAFSGVDGVLLLVALVAVFIILVLVYRSLLLPVLVLLNAVSALALAIGVVYYLAAEDILVLNGQSQGILSILVIGAATDYALLLVARYREELLTEHSIWNGLVAAWRGSFGAIAASAATVLVALLMLLLSDLNSNKSLGPIAALGVFFAWLVTLSFLPALLGLFRRVAFWPAIPRPGTQQYKTAQTTQHIPGLEENHGIWNKIGALVHRRPRIVWVSVSIVLVIAASALTQLKASGVAETEVLLGESEAVTAQEIIQTHYDAGVSAPVSVFAPEDELGSVLDTLKDFDGVAQVYPTDENGAPAFNTPPAVVDGTVYIQAVLDAAPDSLAAENTVVAMRQELTGISPDIVVGGSTATQLDSNQTAQEDFRKVAPAVLIVVFLLLIVLLRSLVAPLILTLATVLSFAAALGVSALVFNHVFEFPGADPSVPLYSFVFLVALGVDYTIFLMARARQETARTGAREAILRSLVVTGGVITSAGVVLAATFAALAVIPLMFMVQLAFIVAFGVLLDTFVVRSLLIPAINYDLGGKMWWPAAIDD